MQAVALGVVGFPAIAKTAVLSVDYRLAPDHRFPAGLDDVLAAYRWGRDNAARFGALPGTAAIGGDSMGGNFAAIVPQEMRRTGEAQPALQLLIYPAVDVASETASMTTYADAYPLSRPIMDWFMGHYMGPDADPADPRLSPDKAADLAGLAPAVVITAGFDPLVDQGEAYAKRLRAAGVPVTYRCYDSLAHGFTAFTGAVPAADAACREVARLVREVVRPLGPTLLATPGVKSTRDGWLNRCLHAREHPHGRGPDLAEGPPPDLEDLEARIVAHPYMSST